jgi:group I intron endonuclease
VTKLTKDRGIYKIENAVNGKLYVGSTKCLRKRKNGHFSNLRHNVHHSSHLQNAFNKYGEDNLIFSVLEYCEEIDLEEKEAVWIVNLRSSDRRFGYNARIHVSSNRGFKHTEESKRKMSESRKGKGRHPYKISEYPRKLKSEICKKQNPGQYRTPESERRRLQSLRESIAGKPISDKHKKCIGNKNRGAGNGQSKLCENDIVQIKYLLSEGKHKTSKIAKSFSVSPRTIRMIKTGERWSHVAV